MPEHFRRGDLEPNWLVLARPSISGVGDLEPNWRRRGGLSWHGRASPALGRLRMMRRRARAGPRRAGGSKGNLRMGRGIEGQLARGPGDRRAASRGPGDRRAACAWAGDRRAACAWAGDRRATCAWAAESKKQTCARAGDRRATCAWAAASKARTGSAGLERAARVVSCSSTTCVGFERLVEFYMLARYRAGPLVGMGASVVAHAMFCSPASVVAWCEAALAGLLSVRIASLSMCIASLSMRIASPSMRTCLAVTAACLQARRARPQPWQAADLRADRSWPQYGSTSGSIPSSKVSCASRWGRIRVVAVAKRVASWRYCASGSSSPLAAPLSRRHEILGVTY
jgi:hypothetical protein